MTLLEIRYPKNFMQNFLILDMNGLMESGLVHWKFDPWS